MVQVYKGEADLLKDLGFQDLSYGNGPGIYVLVLKGVIQWVGKSKNGLGRIGNHFWTKQIIYDQVFFIRVEASRLREAEWFWIDRLQPKLNRIMKDKSRWDYMNKYYYDKERKKRRSEETPILRITPGGLVEKYIREPIKEWPSGIKMRRL